jgi:ABC-type transport system involved in multi-copper enzyme maturation permease subunit
MAVAALTRLTLSDTIRQPVTWLTVLVSIALLGITFLFGQFNFETQDRLRMMSTAGVAVALLNGLFLAIMGASQSVHDELSSRTALTLFAKPLSRSSFLLGKVCGIWLTIAAAGIVIGIAHGLILWAAIYTGFELDPSRRDFVGHEDLWVPWQEVIWAHVFALLHSAVMTCIAAILALRLPLVANILLCLAVFVLSHVAAGFGVPGTLVLPSLHVYQVDDSIQLPDHPLSLGYIGLTVLYTALYCAGCLFIGLALFKKQDIA